MTRQSSRIQAILRDLLVQANYFEKVNRRMNSILARPREKAQRPLAGHKVNSPGQSSDLYWHLAYGFGLTMMTTNGLHVFLRLQNLGLAMCQPRIKRHTFKVLLNISYDNSEWI